MKTLQGVIKPVLGILALKSREARSFKEPEGRNVYRYKDRERIVKREFYMYIIHLHTHTHKYV